VHNEEAFLNQAIRKLRAITKTKKHDFLLAIAEDGSEDCTYQAAMKSAEKRAHAAEETFENLENW
jgi:hypothetical protein